MTPTNVLSRGLSGYLDILRVGAAVVVLLSHFAYARFTEERYRLITDFNLGHDAVVLFFVLSGFVITFAATCKDKTGSRYAFSRLSRLWSVAIPALVLTVLFDGWGRVQNLDFYLNSPFENMAGTWEYWWRGLTFSGHWGSDKLRFGSNGPYWSISYEAAYYIAFGIMLYLRGALRWIAMAVCGLIFGLKVWLLAPAWFMGVGLYLLLRRIDPSRYSSSQTSVMIVVPLIIYVFLLYIDLPDILIHATRGILGEDKYDALGFSYGFIWCAIIGTLFSLHLFGMAIRLSNRDTPLRGQNWVKWLAGGSFSLYLVHYPVLQWGGAVIPRMGVWYVDHTLLLFVTCGVCYLFAEVFERPLPQYRKRVLALVSKRVQPRND